MSEITHVVWRDLHHLCIPQGMNFSETYPHQFCFASSIHLGFNVCICKIHQIFPPSHCLHLSTWIKENHLIVFIDNQSNSWEAACIKKLNPAAMRHTWRSGDLQHFLWLKLILQKQALTQTNPFWQFFSFFKELSPGKTFTSWATITAKSI